MPTNPGTVGGSTDYTLVPGDTQNPDGTFSHRAPGSGKTTNYRVGPDGQWHAIGVNGEDAGVYDPAADNQAENYVNNSGLNGKIAQLRDENSNASNAYNWGGEQGGAAKDAAWSNGWANLVANRAAPTANLANDAQSRGLMMAGAQGYQGMLAGTGPSLADSAMRNGMQTAQGNAAQLQAGASRNNMAAAGRGAMLGLAGGGQAATQAGVNQRLAEQNAATGGLATASTQMYAGDANSAQKRAELELASRSQNDAAAANFTNNAINVQGQQMQGQNARQNAKQLNQNRWNDQQQSRYALNKQASDRSTATVMKGAETMFGMASDENLKTEIVDGTDDVREAMDALTPYNYRYKDEGLLGAGKRVGIMAQDLEKSKLGKATVVETKIGKVVDPPKAMGLVLASVADLNKRLAKVEK